MADAVKCAHPACECTVQKGGEWGKYCSEYLQGNEGQDRAALRLPPSCMPLTPFGLRTVSHL